MKLNTLRDLYVEQLRDLYNAEKQLTKALPKMAKASTSPQLKKAFETHLKETEGHIKRLEQVFGLLDLTARGKTCKAMQGLVEEGSEMIEEEADPEVMDAGLIAAAQRVEHYEIAAYGTVRTYAQLLGEKQAVQLHQQTLDEEKHADELLTQIAEKSINLQANEGTNTRAKQSQ
jgi:ferritin-like metal-binding protein YciE